jgi:hypothetical protein
MYVPLTDDELEVLSRLAQAGEFKVVVKDWGHVKNFLPGRYDPMTYAGQPIVTFGDKRISFYFRMHFNAPAVPQPNWYFDMEVWALGFRLFPGAERDASDPFPGRLPTEIGGKPISLAAGMHLDLALDVAIDKIDPRVVKTVKPKALGLTTRHGNMQLDTHHQRLLHQTRRGEQMVRHYTLKEAADITKKMKKATGR